MLCWSSAPGAHTQGGVGVLQVLLVNEAVSVLVHECERLKPRPGSPGCTPFPGSGSRVLSPALHFPGDPSGMSFWVEGFPVQEQGLTSLNSWIWVCSKLEKTLDDALWARRAPPSFFLAFLLA